MVLTKRYEYSPLEEIFFAKPIENSQYYEDIEEEKNKKDKNNKNNKNNKKYIMDINRIKDNILQYDSSLDRCQKKKDYYLSTKNTNNIQNYYFFYDYRKCIYNIDGKMYMDRNPVRILNDNNKRDDRLNEAVRVQNYNSFVYAYNI
ncbi:hypothetical protein MKS88_000545 [Plasmodium brasilianum]|uniref:Uncharacterized protein n=2 Tax=Plasmodium (Plasmodium) TaxID=418103 RepID=A0A1A8WYU7_PLAMA|nr:hypothetical protein MKS88_000545 [Plasmodium brasilianum]SBS96583.1 hypothetical protein PMALA_055010 [Plasmodium malariae]